MLSPEVKRQVGENSLDNLAIVIGIYNFLHTLSWDDHSTRETAADEFRTFLKAKRAELQNKQEIQTLTRDEMAVLGEIEKLMHDDNLVVSEVDAAFVYAERERQSLHSFDQQREYTI